jgi:short-subunit dehydrogenase
MGAMTAPEVAEQAYRAMQGGRTMMVHGLKNKLAAFSVRLSPRAMIRAIAAGLNRTAATQPALKA